MFLAKNEQVARNVEMLFLKHVKRRQFLENDLEGYRQTVRDMRGSEDQTHHKIRDKVCEKIEVTVQVYLDSFMKMQQHHEWE